jgi:hypothetical protein
MTHALLRQNYSFALVLLFFTVFGGALLLSSRATVMVPVPEPALADEVASFGAHSQLQPLW